MKKVLFILSLIALASAAFADLPITDWRVYTSGGYKGDDAIIRDAEPNGFDFDRRSDADTTYFTNFRSGEVFDWVYDESDVFTITLTGFEDVYPGEGNNLSSLIVELYNSNDGAAIVYASEYGGAGTYVFDFDNAVAARKDFGPGYDVERIYIALGETNASGRYTFANTTPNTYGSVRFMMGRPETEVPEPGTIAYALMGLGSLAGIKRRIKK